MVQASLYSQIAANRKDDQELQACVRGTVEQLLKEETSTKRPGVLLGKIQGGKTRAFIGVIASAFDQGYDVAVLLTKGTKSLARQTLNRVQKDFEPFFADDLVHVFDIMALPSLTNYELSHKLIFVVKKEDDNLKRLLSAFRDAHPSLRERKVLIIDGDLRKPRMHELFDLPNDRGFSSLLCHSPLPENQLKGIVQETSIPGLSVLTSGPAIESAADLLYSADLSELLAEFKTEFDFVIIDTPPMSQMPDARVLGRLADAVILVTRAGHTTRQAAEDAYRRLIEDKARVLGTVLNDWNPKNGGRYYGHGYNYPN